MKALSLLICVVSLPSLTTSTNRTLRFSSQPQFTLHKWRKLKPKRCSSSKNSLRKWHQDLMTKDQDHKTELLLLLRVVSTKMMVQTPQMDQKLPALLPSSSYSLPSNSLRIRWTITTPSTTLSTLLEENQDLTEEKNQENTKTHLQLLLLFLSLRPHSSWRTRSKHKTKPKLE